MSVGCVGSQRGHLKGHWSHLLWRGFGLSPGGAGVAPGWLDRKVSFIQIIAKWNTSTPPCLQQSRIYEYCSRLTVSDASVVVYTILCFLSGLKGKWRKMPNVCGKKPHWYCRNQNNANYSPLLLTGFIFLVQSQRVHTMQRKTAHLTFPWRKIDWWCRSCMTGVTLTNFWFIISQKASQNAH